MYKEIFVNLSSFYPDFYDSYEKFYMERFIYSSTEIEGIKTKEERKMFVNTLMRAFHETYNYESCGMLDVTVIRNIGNLINREKDLKVLEKLMFILVIMLHFYLFYRIKYTHIYIH